MSDDSTAGQSWVRPDDNSAGVMYSIPFTLPRHFRWKPQPDITAYELALCIGPIMASSIDAIDRLPDNARRHFEEA